MTMTEPYKPFIVMPVI